MMGKIREDTWNFLATGKIGERLVESHFGQEIMRLQKFITSLNDNTILGVDSNDPYCRSISHLLEIIKKHPERFTEDGIKKFIQKYRNSQPNDRIDKDRLFMLEDFFEAVNPSYQDQAQTQGQGQTQQQQSNQNANVPDTVNPSNNTLMVVPQDQQGNGNNGSGSTNSDVTNKSIATLAETALTVIQIPQGDPQKEEALAQLDNLLNSGVPAVVDNSNKQLAVVDNNNQQDEAEGGVQESNLKGAYLMWPANPPFLTETTKKNIKYAESLIGPTVPQSNVFIYVPRAGGDGDFSSSCLDIYLHSQLGLGSKLKSKKGFAGITSVKTFILQIKNTIQKATENKEAEQQQQAQTQTASSNGNTNTHLKNSTQMSARERMLARLFEEEGQKTVQGDSSSAQKTTATAVGGAATLQQSYENAIVIYATPRVRQDFEKFRDVFKQDLGLDLVLPDVSHGNIMEDDKDALAGGKQVYQDILSFINGEKTGSAGAEDTKVAVKSMQAISEAGPKPTQQPDPQDDAKEEKPDPAKGKWDWSYIKTLTGAKQVIQKIFADVELLKKGFDDGGNPNKMFLAAKAAATEYAKKWAAALGDGGDMMLEGVGMGWIVPAFKKGMEKLRSAEEEYQGIEAFIRSDKSNTLISLLEDPTFYIEYGSETGGKS